MIECKEIEKIGVEGKRYIFSINDEKLIDDGIYIISDCDGELSYLDSDGYPLDSRIKNILSDRIDIELGLIRK